MNEEAGERQRRDFTLVWAMAISQVIAIGCLFHSFTLFLKPLQNEFGWTGTQMTGAFTLGLFTADLIAIPVGQWIDRRGAHLVMTAGAMLAVVALVAWTFVNSLVGFYLLWLCIGVAIGCTLGNTPVSIIAANVRDYRRGITYLSIVAGLSTTIVIPIVSYLLSAYGWRVAVMGLAVMQFVGPALLNMTMLRGTVGSRTAEFQRRKSLEDAGRPLSERTIATSPLATALRRPAFWLLAIAASVHWFCITAVNVHIMPLLQERGLGTQLVVLIFSINGPAAVAGRILLHLFDRSGSARFQGRVTFPVFGLGMLMLIFFAPFGAPGMIAYAIVFGMAAGVLMIVRQTAIAEIFGLRGYGAISGALTTVAIIPRTSAPVVVALAAERLGSYEPVLWMLFGLIVIGAIAFWLATRDVGRA